MVIVDDNDLAEQFRRVFPTAQEGWLFYDADKSTVCYRIEGHREGAFTVSKDGCAYATGLLGREASYLVMQGIGDSFCSQANKSLYIAHAGAVRLGDEVVMFMGSSGSGKTSLALAFSQFSALMGDECVFINIQDGTAWCEDFPFQIKDNNADILSMLGHPLGIAVEGEPHGCAHYYPRNCVSQDPKPVNPGKIRCIVFPEYDELIARTQIDGVPSSRLVQNILGSLIGNCPPSEAFKTFVHMASINHIELTALRYGDVDDAANALRLHLEERETHEL